MKKKYCSVLLLCIELCQGLLSLLCGRIPIWAYAKLILTCWLVIPYFSGAAYVYEHYVRPFFVNQQTINIWYVPRKKDIFSKPNDILTAAEQYIAENGTEEFQKMINKVCNHVCLGESYITQNFESIGKRWKDWLTEEYTDITSYMFLQVITNICQSWFIVSFVLFCRLTSPGMKITRVMTRTIDIEHCSSICCYMFSRSKCVMKKIKNL